MEREESELKLLQEEFRKLQHFVEHMQKRFDKKLRIVVEETQRDFDNLRIQLISSVTGQEVALELSKMREERMIELREENARLKERLKELEGADQ